MADPTIPGDETIGDADMRKIAAAKYQMMKALGGLAAQHQGVLLADLLSMWVAAHFVCDQAGTAQPADTDTLRESLLQHHVHMVREFVPFSEQELSEGDFTVEALDESEDASTRH